MVSTSFKVLLSVCLFLIPVLNVDRLFIFSPNSSLLTNSPGPVTITGDTDRIIIINPLAGLLMTGITITQRLHLIIRLDQSRRYLMMLAANIRHFGNA